MTDFLGFLTNLYHSPDWDQFSPGTQAALQQSTDQFTQAHTPRVVEFDPAAIAQFNQQIRGTNRTSGQEDLRALEGLCNQRLQQRNQVRGQYRNIPSLNDATAITAIAELTHQDELLKGMAFLRLQSAVQSRNPANIVQALQQYNQSIGFFIADLREMGDVRAAEDTLKNVYDQIIQPTIVLVNYLASQLGNSQQQNAALNTALRQTTQHIQASWRLIADMIPQNPPAQPQAGDASDFGFLREFALSQSDLLQRGLNEGPNANSESYNNAGSARDHNEAAVRLAQGTVAQRHPTVESDLGYFINEVSSPVLNGENPRSLVPTVPQAARHLITAHTSTFITTLCQEIDQSHGSTPEALTTRYGRFSLVMESLFATRPQLNFRQGLASLQNMYWNEELYNAVQTFITRRNAMPANAGHAITFDHVLTALAYNPATGTAPDAALTALKTEVVGVIEQFKQRNANNTTHQGIDTRNLTHRENGALSLLRGSQQLHQMLPFLAHSLHDSIARMPANSDERRILLDTFRPTSDLDNPSLSNLELGKAEILLALFNNQTPTPASMERFRTAGPRAQQFARDLLTFINNRGLGRDDFQHNLDAIMRLNVHPGVERSDELNEALAKFATNRVHSRYPDYIRTRQAPAWLAALGEGTYTAVATPQRRTEESNQRILSELERAASFLESGALFSQTDSSTNNYQRIPAKLIAFISLAGGNGGVHNMNDARLETDAEHIQGILRTDRHGLFDDSNSVLNEILDLDAAVPAQTNENFGQITSQWAEQVLNTIRSHESGGRRWAENFVHDREFHPASFNVIRSVIGGTGQQPSALAQALTSYHLPNSDLSYNVTNTARQDQETHRAREVIMGFATAENLLMNAVMAGTAQATNRALQSTEIIASGAPVSVSQFLLHFANRFSPFNGGIRKANVLWAVLRPAAGIAGAIGRNPTTTAFVTTGLAGYEMASLRDQRIREHNNAHPENPLRFDLYEDWAKNTSMMMGLAAPLWYPSYFTKARNFEFWGYNSLRNTRVGNLLAPHTWQPGYRVGFTLAAMGGGVYAAERIRPNHPLWENVAIGAGGALAVFAPLPLSNSPTVVNIIENGSVAQFARGAGRLGNIAENGQSGMAGHLIVGTTSGLAGGGVASGLNYLRDTQNGYESRFLGDMAQSGLSLAVAMTANSGLGALMSLPGRMNNWRLERGMTPAEVSARRLTQAEQEIQAVLNRTTVSARSPRSILAGARDIGLTHALASALVATTGMLLTEAEVHALHNNHILPHGSDMAAAFTVESFASTYLNMLAFEGANAGMNRFRMKNILGRTRSTQIDHLATRLTEGLPVATREPARAFVWNRLAIESLRGRDLSNLAREDNIRQWRADYEAGTAHFRGLVRTGEGVTLATRNTPTSIAETHLPQSMINNLASEVLAFRGDASPANVRVYMNKTDGSVVREMPAADQIHSAQQPNAPFVEVELGFTGGRVHISDTTQAELRALRDAPTTTVSHPFVPTINEILARHGAPIELHPAAVALSEIVRAVRAENLSSDTHLFVTATESGNEAYRDIHSIDAALRAEGQKAPNQRNAATIQRLSNQRDLFLSRRLLARVEVGGSSYDIYKAANVEEVQGTGRIRQPEEILDPLRASDEELLRLFGTANHEEVSRRITDLVSEVRNRMIFDLTVPAMNVPRDRTAPRRSLSHWLEHPNDQSLQIRPRSSGGQWADMPAAWRSLLDRFSNNAESGQTVHVDAQVVGGTATAPLSAQMREPNLVYYPGESRTINRDSFLSPETRAMLPEAFQLNLRRTSPTEWSLENFSTGNGVAVEVNGTAIANNAPHVLAAGDVIRIPAGEEGGQPRFVEINLDLNHIPAPARAMPEAHVTPTQTLDHSHITVSAHFDEIRLTNATPTGVRLVALESPVRVTCMNADGSRSLPNDIEMNQGSARQFHMSPDQYLLITYRNDRGQPVTTRYNFVTAPVVHNLPPVATNPTGHGTPTSTLSHGDTMPSLNGITLTSPSANGLIIESNGSPVRVTSYDNLGNMIGGHTEFRGRTSGLTLADGQHALVTYVDPAGQVHVFRFNAAASSGGTTRTLPSLASNPLGHGTPTHTITHGTIIPAMNGIEVTTPRENVLSITPNESPIRVTIYNRDGSRPTLDHPEFAAGSGAHEFTLANDQYALVTYVEQNGQPKVLRYYAAVSSSGGGSGGAARVLPALDASATGHGHAAPTETLARDTLPTAPAGNPLNAYVDATLGVGSPRENVVIFSTDKSPIRVSIVNADGTLSGTHSEFAEGSGNHEFNLTAGQHALVTYVTASRGPQVLRYNASNVISRGIPADHSAALSATHSLASLTAPLQLDGVRVTQLTDSRIKVEALESGVRLHGEEIPLGTAVELDLRPNENIDLSYHKADGTLDRVAIEYTSSIRSVADGHNTNPAEVYNLASGTLDEQLEGVHIEQIASGDFRISALESEVRLSDTDVFHASARTIHLNPGEFANITYTKADGTSATVQVRQPIQRQFWIQGTDVILQDGTRIGLDHAPATFEAREAVANHYRNTAGNDVDNPNHYRFNRAAGATSAPPHITATACPQIVVDLRATRISGVPYATATLRTDAYGNITGIENVQGELDISRSLGDNEIRIDLRANETHLQDLGNLSRVNRRSLEILQSSFPARAAEPAPAAGPTAAPAAGPTPPAASGLALPLFNEGDAALTAFAGHPRIVFNGKVYILPVIEDGGMARLTHAEIPELLVNEGAKLVVARSGDDYSVSAVDPDHLPDTDHCPRRVDAFMAVFKMGDQTYQVVPGDPSAPPVAAAPAGPAPASAPAAHPLDDPSLRTTAEHALAQGDSSLTYAGMNASTVTAAMNVMRDLPTTGGERLFLCRLEPNSDGIHAIVPVSEHAMDGAPATLLRDHILIRVGTPDIRVFRTPDGLQQIFGEQAVNTLIDLIPRVEHTAVDRLDATRITQRSEALARGLQIADRSTKLQALILNSYSGEYAILPTSDTENPYQVIRAEINVPNTRLAVISIPSAPGDIVIESSLADDHLDYQALVHALTHNFPDRTVRRHAPPPLPPAGGPSSSGGPDAHGNISFNPDPAASADQGAVVPGAGVATVATPSVDLAVAPHPAEPAVAAPRPDLIVADPAVLATPFHLDESLRAQTPYVGISRAQGLTESLPIADGETIDLYTMRAGFEDLNLGALALPSQNRALALRMTVHFGSNNLHRVGQVRRVGDQLILIREDNTTLAHQGGRYEYESDRIILETGHEICLGEYHFTFQEGRLTFARSENRDLVATNEHAIVWDPMQPGDAIPTPSTLAQTLHTQNHALYSAIAGQRVDLNTAQQIEASLRSDLSISVDCLFDSASGALLEWNTYRLEFLASPLSERPGTIRIRGRYSEIENSIEFMNAPGGRGPLSLNLDTGRFANPLNEPTMSALLQSLQSEVGGLLVGAPAHDTLHFFVNSRNGAIRLREGAGTRTHAHYIEVKIHQNDRHEIIDLEYRVVGDANFTSVIPTTLPVHGLDQEVQSCVTALQEMFPSPTSRPSAAPAPAAAVAAPAVSASPAAVQPHVIFERAAERVLPEALLARLDSVTDKNRPVILNFDPVGGEVVAPSYTGAIQIQGNFDPATGNTTVVFNDLPGDHEHRLVVHSDSGRIELLPKNTHSWDPARTPGPGDNTLVGIRRLLNVFPGQTSLRFAINPLTGEIRTRPNPPSDYLFIEMTRDPSGAITDLGTLRSARGRHAMTLAGFTPPPGIEPSRVSIFTALQTLLPPPAPSTVAEPSAVLPAATPRAAAPTLTDGTPDLTAPAPGLSAEPALPVTRIQVEGRAAIQLHSTLDLQFGRGEQQTLADVLRAQNETIPENSLLNHVLIQRRDGRYYFRLTQDGMVTVRRGNTDMTVATAGYSRRHSSVGVQSVGINNPLGEVGEIVTLITETEAYPLQLRDFTAPSTPWTRLQQGIRVPGFFNSLANWVQAELGLPATLWNRPAAPADNRQAPPPPVNPAAGAPVNRHKVQEMPAMDPEALAREQAAVRERAEAAERERAETQAQAEAAARARAEAEAAARAQQAPAQARNGSTPDDPALVTPLTFTVNPTNPLEQTCVVGRGQAGGNLNSSVVARQQARIIARDGHFLIEDLSSDPSRPANNVIMSIIPDARGAAPMAYALTGEHRGTYVLASGNNARWRHLAFIDNQGRRVQLSLNHGDFLAFGSPDIGNTSVEYYRFIIDGNGLPTLRLLPEGDVPINPRNVDHSPSTGIHDNIPNEETPTPARNPAIGPNLGSAPAAPEAAPTPGIDPNLAWGIHPSTRSPFPMTPTSTVVAQFTRTVGPATFTYDITAAGTSTAGHNFYDVIETPESATINGRPGNAQESRVLSNRPLTAQELLALHNTGAVPADAEVSTAWVDDASTILLRENEGTRVFVCRDANLALATMVANHSPAIIIEDPNYPNVPPRLIGHLFERGNQVGIRPTNPGAYPVTIHYADRHGQMYQNPVEAGGAWMDPGNYLDLGPYRYLLPINNQSGARPTLRLANESDPVRMLRVEPNRNPVARGPVCEAPAVVPGTMADPQLRFHTTEGQPLVSRTLDGLISQLDAVLATGHTGHVVVVKDPTGQYHLYNDQPNDAPVRSIVVRFDTEGHRILTSSYSGGTTNVETARLMEWQSVVELRNRRAAPAATPIPGSLADPSIRILGQDGRQRRAASIEMLPYLLDTLIQEGHTGDVIVLRDETGRCYLFNHLPEDAPNSTIVLGFGITGHSINAGGAGFGPLTAGETTIVSNWYQNALRRARETAPAPVEAQPAAPASAAPESGSPAFVAGSMADPNLRILGQEGRPSVANGIEGLTFLFDTMLQSDYSGHVAVLKDGQGRFHLFNRMPEDAPNSAVVMGFDIDLHSISSGSAAYGEAAGQRELAFLSRWFGETVSRRSSATASSSRQSARTEGFASMPTSAPEVQTAAAPHEPVASYPSPVVHPMPALPSTRTPLALFTLAQFGNYFYERATQSSSTSALLVHLQRTHGQAAPAISNHQLGNLAGVTIRVVGDGLTFTPGLNQQLVLHVEQRVGSSDVNSTHVSTHSEPYTVAIKPGMRVWVSEYNPRTGQIGDRSVCFQNPLVN